MAEKGELLYAAMRREEVRTNDWRCRLPETHLNLNPFFYTALTDTTRLCITRRSFNTELKHSSRCRKQRCISGVPSICQLAEHPYEYRDMAVTYPLSPRTSRIAIVGLVTTGKAISMNGSSFSTSSPFTDLTASSMQCQG